MVGELVDQRVNTEVASSYLDVWGHEKAIDPAVRAALLEAMGPARKAREVKLESGRCYQPPILQRRRLWGFMTQLYGLRSQRNWGIGDFTDLRDLVGIAARLGAAVVGVSPLHATHGSPYNYDAHIPLVIMGRQVKMGRYPGHVALNDLAPTLAALIDVDAPAGSSGRVLIEALDFNRALATSR